MKSDLKTFKFIKHLAITVLLPVLNLSFSICDVLNISQRFFRLWDLPGIEGIMTRHMLYADPLISRKCCHTPNAIETTNT